MRNQRDGSIIIAGIVGSIIVAILTVLATMLVVSKLNDNADEAYAMALNSYVQSKASAQTQTQTKPPEDDTSQAGSTNPETPGGAGSSDEDASLTLGEEDENTTPDPGTVPAEGEQGSSENAAAVDKIDSTQFLGIEYLSLDGNGNAVYVVKQGDTLSHLQKVFGIDYHEIADKNGIENVNLIITGDTLVIPVSADAIRCLEQMGGSGQQVQPHVNTGPDRAFD